MIAMKPNGVVKAYYLKFRFITYPSKFQFIVIIRLLWLEWVVFRSGFRGHQQNRWLHLTHCL